ISAIISNGATISGQAVQNLFVACGYGATNYFRKYQGVGSVTRVENSANSIYNSLQVALRRSLGDLTLSASYTYSHSIDDSSDRYDLVFTYPGDFGLSRGSSNFDVRQAYFRYLYGIVRIALHGDKRHYVQRQCGSRARCRISGVVPRSGRQSQRGDTGRASCLCRGGRVRSPEVQSGGVCASGRTDVRYGHAK